MPRLIPPPQLSLLMNEDISDIQRLIRLKRHEQPPADFVDNFMEEFVRRQRTEQMKRPWYASILEGISSFFESWSTPQWALTTAAAALVVGAVMLWTPGGSSLTSGTGSVQTVKMSSRDWQVAPQIYLDSSTGELRKARDLSVYLLGNHFSGGFTSDASDLTPKQVIEEVPTRGAIEVEPLFKFKDE
jgi:hypothetical protein